jgi:hypothetical protein
VVARAFWLHLTDQQARYCVELADHRRAARYGESHAAPMRDAEREVIGIAGELAVILATDDLDQRGDDLWRTVADRALARRHQDAHGDVDGLEVRSSGYATSRLILRETDRHGYAYVLVYVDLRRQLVALAGYYRLVLPALPDRDYWPLRVAWERYERRGTRTWWIPQSALEDVRRLGLARSWAYAPTPEDEPPSWL